MKVMMFIFAFLCVTPLFAIEQSTGTKIATINAEKIYERYVNRLKYEAELKAQADAAEEELEKLNEVRIEARHKFEKLKEEISTFTLRQEIIKEKSEASQLAYRAWKSAEVECENFAKKFREKQKLAFESMREKLKNEIQAAIRSRATLEGYDMVLDNSAKSVTDLNVILYAKPSLDLTEQLIQELNQGKE